MSLPSKRRRSPAEGEFLFELDPEPLKESVAGFRYCCGRRARWMWPGWPGTVAEYYFRGDSACWDRGLVLWLRDEQRCEGPQGRIRFGISVRMTANLKKHILRLPENLWKGYRKDGESESECVGLFNYWPEEEDRPEGAGPLRYALCGDSGAPGARAVHDVLKNELAGGVMPCGWFGANAAWMRLAVLTHNVLTALKRIGLPEPWLRSRPKRLRFGIFCSPGKLVHHARRRLRVQRGKEQVGEWLAAWGLMPVRA